MEGQPAQCDQPVHCELPASFTLISQWSKDNILRTSDLERQCCPLDRPLVWESGNQIPFLASPPICCMILVKSFHLSVTLFPLLPFVFLVYLDSTCPNSWHAPTRYFTVPSTMGSQQQLGPFGPTVIQIINAWNSLDCFIVPTYELSTWYPTETCHFFNIVPISCCVACLK